MRLFFKRFSVKTKFILIVVSVVFMYLITSFALLKQVSFKKADKSHKNSTEIKSVKLQNVIVHLDLKGSPPKLDYLKSLLTKLQVLGVTGLLIEYEDMFPYGGKLVNLSARNCYERPKEFLKLAAHVGFDIIPLVQTFGHMEYALKLPEYRNLREMLTFPDSICPSKYGSQLLIKEMLKQVIEFHQNITPLKYLHIGCDEVFHINKCKQCSLQNQTNTKIYLNHVKTVTDFVKAISPHTAVLIWDDMFRKIPVNVWDTKSTKHPLADVVYWDYEPEIKTSHINLMKYHKTFENIWIASAFKGADGRTKTFPNLKNRLSNHFSWMKFILDYKFGGESKIYEFKGIILTGWSRYSHFDPPCELLPVSLPSLYLNLLLIKQFKEGFSSSDDLVNVFDTYVKDSLTHHLHGSGFVDLEYFDTNQCYFDGNVLYLTLKQWEVIKEDILNTINDDENGLLSIDYYYKTRNVNINNLQKNIDWSHDTLQQVDLHKSKLIKTLSQYYDKFFVDEYVNFKLYTTQKLLRNYFKDLNSMLKIQSWSRRPFI